LKVTLGINCGFAINRFPRPEEWAWVVADWLGLHKVQFVADLLNPFLPAGIVEADSTRIQELCREKSISIESTFTSAFTRVNHLAHPDSATRSAWIDWFKSFLTISRYLGARSSGSHFGIMSVADFKDSRRRREATARAVDGWVELSRHAAEIGLECLLFEPMSVPREFAATIDETVRLMNLVNESSAVPMRLCLDIDHGDVASSDPRDTDPYAWLRELGRYSPVIHIKQSSADKGGHWPFTDEKNATGRITPDRVLAALEDGGVEETMLTLELSFRERWPAEDTILDDLRASVEYWRPFVDV